jgi:hypothetical protein
MAEFEGAVLIGSDVSEYPRIDIIHPEVSSMQHSTDMRPLLTGIRSEKCVFRRFRRRADVYLHKPR